MFQRRLMQFQSCHKSLWKQRRRQETKKDDRLLLHPTRRQRRLTERDKNLQMDQAIKRKALQTRLKFHADSNSAKKPSCKFWHPPVCQNYKSEKGCVCGNKCHFRHVEAEGKANKGSKKGGAKGSVAILKETFSIGLCVSTFSSEKIYST